MPPTVYRKIGLRGIGTPDEGQERKEGREKSTADSRSPLDHRGQISIEQTPGTGMAKWTEPLFKQWLTLSPSFFLSARSGR
ncbi:hypothetical protein KM043_013946 [Ampulex compressa]|nr:hypothetical protein KM043_013946 [Ampulex compressa]